MAYLDIPEGLSPVEFHLRNMYWHYKKVGLDLSEPMHSSIINKLRDQYERENSIDPLFFLNKGNNNPGILITSEVFSFSDDRDVSINKHLRYCPVPVHAHEYYEIMCIIKGSCSVYIGSNLVQMQAGDTIIVPPFLVHTISVFNNDCIMYSAEIRFSTLQSKFSSLLSTKQLISDLFFHSFNDHSDPCYLLIRTGDYFLGDNKFGDIVAEFNNSQKYSCEIINILTSAFLYDLLRNFSKTATITTIKDKSRFEIMLTKYISDHMDTVTLTDLSQTFSYSNRQMSRIIKQTTGLSYSDLVKKIKMESIAKTLVVTDLPINKIMEMSGISSPSYFFKTFRAYFGETPLEYRNSRTAKAV